MKIRGQTVYSHEERLRRMSVVNEQSGCWEWRGSKRCGYGRLVIGSRSDGTRKSVSAHCLSYETFVGPIPEGHEVCHKCDNRRCVNPDHLFAGTRQDNIDDREARGRNVVPRGEKNGNAKLTASDVIEARAARETGATFQSIANIFGVSKRTILDAIKGRSWASVPPPPIAALTSQAKEGDGG